MQIPLTMQRFNEAMIFRPWKAEGLICRELIFTGFNEAMIFRPWKDSKCTHPND